MREELESLAQIAGPGELGSLTRAAERAREVWGVAWLDSIWADWRIARRSLRRQPGFTAVAVISLAVGIGANTAIFSFADAILLRPLPVRRASEILSIGNATPEKPSEGLSYPDYRNLRETSRSFSGLIAYRAASLGVAADLKAAPQMRLVTMVSDDFFSVLGVVPYLGRVFSPPEGKVPDEDLVAILGYDFWKTQLGADPSAIGRRLRLNGVELTIIGVAPESFPGLTRFFRPSVFVPLSLWGRLGGRPWSGDAGEAAPSSQPPLEDRALHELAVKGRLRSGATIQSARMELVSIGRNLERAYPGTNRNRRIAVETEFGAVLQQEPARFAIVAIMIALAALVLIIACANVASLLLARSRARRREIATRLAIGAGGFRLMRQLMIENLTLAILGGAAGLGLGYEGIRFLGNVQVPSDIPFVTGLQLDTRVLAFSLIAALTSCLLFGLVPALQTMHFQLVPALKAAGEAVCARRSSFGRNALVVLQIGLAMLLLMVSAMLMDGFRKMLSIDPGFRKDHLIGMQLDPSAVGYSGAETRGFYRKLVGTVSALPSVRSVTLAEAIPLTPDQTSLAVIPEGYQLPNGRENVTVPGGAFDENYFRVMRVGIVRGRAFSAHDVAGSRRVAIVNEQFAKTYWPNQNPIGKRMWLGSATGSACEVVGVAKTGRYQLPWESPAPYVYLPFAQNPHSGMTLVAESYGDPAALASALRGAVYGVDRDLPIFNVRTVAASVNWALSNWFVMVQAIAAMGFLGLTLAVIGLYGLVSYSVSRRTAEIGIRMAVGASRARVLRLILRQGLTLSITGIAIGGVLAAPVGPLIAVSFAHVGNMSAAIYAFVPTVLLVVSLSACYVPARRAASLDPIRALRYE